ncbi:MAG TPA: Re/Si-specific NAD(P)(+) transhydrogenase subunit alpha [Gemmatimonadaceae bacterium]|nr:Re/Si-specific NAD(P)(+) transhydrogenase subunit alpha [Gemmatimonadaceae bacterium]
MAVKIAVPSETAPGELRVALVPESAARLVKSGATVTVQKGAGLRAGFTDAAYLKAGATLADSAAAACGDADVVLRVRRPSSDEIAQIRSGALLIALLQPAQSADTLSALAARKVSAMALEKVPRITRAQSMDVLSSQATVAGYKAVLLGAAALGKFLPMLTTAAGSIRPAQVFVIGAGVAGLQAIATARRLGGVVSAFDVRAAAAEQVQSLGAKFVASELVSAGAEDKGGYAKAQAEDERQRTLDAIGKHIVTQDLTITTALIPNKPAPKLITEAMVKGMMPGAVIVDVAAEAGGNCELTKPGETITAHGVTIIGTLNLAGTVPLHASEMLSRNMLTLLQHLIKDNALTLDPAEEITKAMLVTHEGAIL